LRAKDYPNHSLNDLDRVQLLHQEAVRSASTALYDIAPPRVQQYLESEIAYLISRLRVTDYVLELGCGYGRVAIRIADVAARVVGIDVAEESLSLARQLLASNKKVQFLRMEARALHFANDCFDAVACIQNGVCAFGVDQEQMLEEAWRVLRPGGVLLISTYSDSFWADRLAWFELQAHEGLIGAIDRDASRDGMIACVDGFRAGRATPAQLHGFATLLGVRTDVVEVDDSSLWCELRKPSRQASACAHRQDRSC
jgi:SAM-dependent methyltransferase